MTELNPNGDHEVNDLMEQPKADDSISDTITQAIKMAYPLDRHQLLVDSTQWPLNYLVPNLISDEELTELVAAKDPLTVGRFFCYLGLSETDGGRDLAILIEDIIDEAEEAEVGIVQLILDEIGNGLDEALLIEKVSNILLEDKDSIINNYVVPFYRIPKGDFDAEDPFETALSRGLRDQLDRSVGDSVFCYLRYDLDLFDDSDFVSCFEYVLEATIEDEVDFQTLGLENGYSQHCLDHYPSGFPKNPNDQWFPRCFIVSDEGRLTVDEMRHFISGLPTELDRMVGSVLLEDSLPWRYSDRRSVYYFDGVKALYEDLEGPDHSVELLSIFRDCISDYDQSDIEAILEDGFAEMENHLDGLLGGHPSWIAYSDYAFVWWLSERANVPKKVLNHYRREMNEVHDCYLRGDY